ENSTVATCPVNNTGRGTELIWEQPLCFPKCDSTTPVPSGFVHLGGDVWECEEATHYGTPEVECIVDDTCAPRWKGSGCLPLSNCVLPESDPCRYNMSDCHHVRPGDRCTVTCRAPFAGGSSVASCADHNTDPTQVIDWSPPKPGCALLPCPQPAVVPLGYVAENRGFGFRCEADYKGVAMSYCQVDEFCTPTTVLAGCSKLAPCWPPEVDDCLLDTSNCVQVSPNSSCEVTCKAPFVGTGANVSCPEGNADPWQAAEWVGARPSCTMPSCPAPAIVPEGFVWVNRSWQCAEGFLGTPRVVCNHESDCRPASGRLEGCGRPVECAQPELLTCMYNVSDCVQVYPGASCQVGCKSPYEGRAVQARVGQNSV
ncbi:unnamed protein product, partial [Polarella glacialis]